MSDFANRAGGEKLFRENEFRKIIQQVNQGRSEKR
jgi:hypothetical protein